jgi:hypothetical protein
MSSWAFASASSLRTEDITASLRALRSGRRHGGEILGVTTPFVFSQSRDGKKTRATTTRTKIYLWEEKNRQKLSRCRQKWRTSLLFPFFFKKKTPLFLLNEERERVALRSCS